MTGGLKGNDGVVFGIWVELDTMDVGNWGLGMPTNEFSPDAICPGPDGWEDPEGGSSSRLWSSYLWMVLVAVVDIGDALPCVVDVDGTGDVIHKR